MERKRKNEVAKNVADFDQYSAFIIQTIPAALKVYYDELIKEGFGEELAFELVRDYQRRLVG